MVVRSCAPALLVASVFWGSACGASLEPIQAGAGCPDQPLRGPLTYASMPPYQLIDDFESGDKQMPRLGFRTGYWVLGTDNLAEALTGTVTAEASNRCAARGKWSGHFEASGFTHYGNNWTGVFEAPSASGAAIPYDAHWFGGISFWAAFGGDNTVDFAVPVGITTMDNAWNGGICTTCMDYYATTVPLTHDWRRYMVRFSQLAQAGFGVPQVPTLRRDQLVGLIIWPKQQFDIWIDDVRLEL
jgi:Carbohydrate binding domain (family 11)